LLRAFGRGEAVTWDVQLDVHAVMRQAAAAAKEAIEGGQEAEIAPEEPRPQHFRTARQLRRRPINRGNVSTN
jgi:hypothetical protein